MQMAFILRKILYNNTNYCCLCFQTGEAEFYNLQDEVYIDPESAEKLYEICSTVLGELVLESISINTICRKCTETAISSYKFIEKCKSNVQNLACNIDCLQKYTESKTAGCNYKSVFLGVDVQNYTVKYLYDKKYHYYNEAALLKRFQRLMNESCVSVKNVQTFNTINIDSEPDMSKIYGNSMKKLNKKIKKDQQFIRLSDITMTHENDGPNNYKCKHCAKTYPAVSKLKLHYLRVHAPKEFKCSKCPRKFGSFVLLNRHIKNSHCIVVCSHCGKTYNNTHSLKSHEKSHNLRLVCQSCGKVYKGKKTFDKHIQQKLCKKMRRSNAEAKFFCDYCEKKYSQKTALSVHIRVEHENGKAWICDWCGKKLSSKSVLKDHIVKHTKQKNFDCHICGGQFVTKTSLLYHTRTHTGEKPYKCDHCEMNFLSASRRSEHVKWHHTGLLECDICHSKFKGQTCLARHRKHHFDASSRLYCNLTNKVNKEL